MLTINNLQFERQGTRLFEPISLNVPFGSCLQLCGKNGIGKTTLLKILAGLTKPRRGSILLNEEKIPSLQKHAKYLGHELALKASLTVLENLRYYATLLRANLAEVQNACDFFELLNLQNTRIEDLSAGQKRRVQLAKLLIGKTKIWLLDEPFTALDQTHIQQLLRLFKMFLEKKGVIFFTSHQDIHTHDALRIETFHLSAAHES